MSSGKLLELQSSDGDIIQVEEAVVLEWKTMKVMIDDNCADGVIPLPNVKSKTLHKVVEYSKKHVESAKADDKSSQELELKIFDARFVAVGKEDLFDLVMAANYLNIRSLLDLTCQAVADMIKGKTALQIRSLFNITEHGFTPEEEAANCPGISHYF